MKKRQTKKVKEIRLPSRDYEPSRKQLREKHDMPGANMRVLRRAFFRPIKILKENKSRSRT